MKSPQILILAVLLLGVFVSRNTTAQVKAAGSTIDEEDLKKVLATYVETWNKHDMTAWDKLFTEEVDYVNRGG